MNIQRKGGLFIVSAPSGSGKSTVIQGVMGQVDKLSFSVSYTTREPRAGEQNGREYFFVSDAEFEKMIAAGEFLEYARVFDKFWYGTAKEQVNRLLDSGHDVIMDIDVQGAVQLMDRRDIPHTSIFLIPPDGKELRKRLKNRNREGDAEIGRRLRTASGEVRHLGSFDYLVINDDLEEAIADVRRIVLSQRMRTNRLKNTDQVIKMFQMEDTDD